ncbi:MAG: site-specific integrase, partial [Clostridiales bacterium]|nr:site-specific integrase [Clostridiales bacterium]
GRKPFDQKVNEKGMSGEEKISLTPELIEEFLEYLRQNGRTNGTLIKYRRDLNRLCDFLGDDKTLDSDTLKNWKESMTEQKMNVETVNARMSTGNNLMRFIGQNSWQTKRIKNRGENTYKSPVLTREEYLRLLLAAKRLNKERTYFLVKTICGVGLKVGEIPQLTVEMLKAGEGIITTVGSKRKIYIPSALANELMEYTVRKGITEGSVFITRSGKEIGRVNIHNEIKELAAEADVDEEKCSPSSLWKLYLSTKKEIDDRLEIYARQTYEQILQTEQTVSSWVS